MKSYILILLGLLAILNRAYGMAEPKHKVILKQNGYPQYIHFVTNKRPAMSEFTFCIWVRANNLDREQIIFFYKVQKILDVALWLDTGGNNLILSINDQIWKNPVNLRLKYWQHFCLSYQSYFGALALYTGGRLTSCTVNKLLAGYVVPGGGNFVIGHGSKDNGIPYGLEGEVFGFNMILKSTIKVPPKFKSDKIRDKQLNTDSFKLKDLETSDEQQQDQNSIQNIITMPKNWKPKQDSKLTNKTSNSLQQEDNIDALDDWDTIDTKENKNDLNTIETSESIESTSNVSKPLKIPDSENTDTTLSKTEFKMKSLPKSPRIKAKISMLHTENKDFNDAEAEDVSSISEYEEPPPVDAPNDYVSIEQLNVSKPPAVIRKNEVHVPVDKISEVELPPPIQTNNKVYGQWTSSMFAGRILNYFNKLNQMNRERKVPQTIPLKKVSDEYPYESDNSMAQSPFEVGRNLHLLRRWKRNTSSRQINVKILENDLRSEILKQHALSRPKNVEITNRGETITNMDPRFIKKLQDLPLEVFGKQEQIKTLYPKSIMKNNDLSQRTLDHQNFTSSLHLLHHLPLEQIRGQNKINPDHINKDNSNSMYINSLVNDNWHNVKSFKKQNNPPPMTNKNLETQENSDIRFKPKNVSHDNFIIDFNNKLYSNYFSDSEIKAHPRRIIKAVSQNYTSPVIKKKNKFKYQSYGEQDPNAVKPEKKFTSPVKNKIPVPDEDSQRSLSENVNDRMIELDKHGTKIEKLLSNPPATLNIKICDNNDFIHGTMLYVKTDGSIVTNYVQTIAKNLGVAFVAKSYVRCSASFPNNPIVIINWSSTRIRLFGGATHKAATGLCGIV